jgi:hypothetical protein
MIGQGIMEGGTVNVVLKGGVPAFEVQKNGRRVKAKVATPVA